MSEVTPVTYATKSYPASAKQYAFLAKLGFVDRGPALTSREASALIEMALEAGMDRPAQPVLAVEAWGAAQDRAWEKADAEYAAAIAAATAAARTYKQDECSCEQYDGERLCPRCEAGEVMVAEANKATEAIAAKNAAIAAAEADKRAVVSRWAERQGIAVVDAATGQQLVPPAAKVTEVGMYRTGD